MHALPDVVRRYFESAARPDRDEYFALFAPDAEVHDEGRSHRGPAAIRAWRAEVPLVRYEVTGAERTAEGLVVTATISGDFPGSPVAGLRFRFEDFDDGAIRRLRIAP
ncbi:nuclear transport factor 2 family protein [Saccharothrix longispora]|uniref:nuclear transport factor 2 family protein n=1 Tax=Saccharothrix longispora TaxID=33920 RepID=UPI0028FDA5AB|nr:nuclear transport factor 2 family protein [Saccharothrix longispora]MBY8848787.1 nuclear transport factor 2 family protein [Saccharothrix sp. MB29]MDU0290498.1 nuclear transport factor 2 family protein [Saccharothrix longispora]